MKLKFEYKDNCCSFCDPQLAGRIYWDEGSNGLEGYDKPTEGFYIDEYGLNAVADDPYCGTSPITINYCPICGRSLKVVNKLHPLEKDFKEGENTNG